MRFFLKAAALAILLCTIGFSLSLYRQSRLTTAQTNCEVEGRKHMEAFNISQKGQTGPWTTYQTDPINCDPPQLFKQADYSDVLPGVQGELLRAYLSERSGIDEKFYGWAAFVLFIGVLPICWYFFLARLRELASAIRRG